MRTDVPLIFSRSRALYPVIKDYEGNIFLLCYQRYITSTLKNKKPPINGGLDKILYITLLGAF